MEPVIVSKDEFQEYRDVQDSGLVNMFTPQAREMTTLSKPQWLHILKHYNELKTKYEGE